jgi:hypothetical protein
MGDVEMLFALVVEGRYLGIVPCQPFMTRPSKIVQDCIRRDRPLSSEACTPSVRLVLAVSAFSPPLPFNYAAVRIEPVGSFNSHSA